jgi:hypothetical protein
MRRDPASSAADDAAHPDVSLQDHFGYSAGRRICVGVRVAEQGLFIAVWRLRWCFNIKQKIGTDERHMIPEENSFHNRIMSEPNGFDVETRSPTHENMSRK